MQDILVVLRTQVQISNCYYDLSAFSEMALELSGRAQQGHRQYAYTGALRNESDLWMNL